MPSLIVNVVNACVCEHFVTTAVKCLSMLIIAGINIIIVKRQCCHALTSFQAVTCFQCLCNLTSLLKACIRSISSVAATALVIVRHSQLLQLIHNRFTKCVLTQGGGLVSTFIPSANDNHLIMVTPQPHKRGGLDFSKITFHSTCHKRGIQQALQYI